MRLTQRDLAYALDMSAMSVSRAATRLGRPMGLMSEDLAFELLVAGALRERGISWPQSIRLVCRFSSEIRGLASNIDERRLWVVFVNATVNPFTVMAISPSHLANVISRHPLARTIGLHEPVSEAIEQLDALKTRKTWAWA
ncbi:hypothetical protein [Ancylobacter oerskovii]|uniref:Uncharacterized protein n=1 Tax=Ancylobacter oerskovii TaxID=459519 RepID=A0ABW4YR18_9HYPH|nr:hypothetical protein [Ancylobacter oerskovii]MBS7545726.1 hypothetical protein [Ancylobacter oerskovii]